MNDFCPLISIIIPVYNGSNYIREAIDSALAQTYPNFEVIVVNDGSRDDGATERAVLSYGNRVRYISKENGGSSSALNMGIANMRGEWFSWLSHDDLYAPEKLERQIAYMIALNVNESELSKHIFFSSSELIDANGKIIRAFQENRACHMAAKVDSITHNGYLVAEPTVYNFHGCSCLIHRDAFELVGRFDESLRFLNDMDLWFRLYIANYKVHYIPEPLVKGRVHSAQVSKSIGYSYHNSEQDMYWKRSLDWLKNNYPDNYDLYYFFGKNAYLKTRNGDGDDAWIRAISLNPQARMSLLVKKYLYQTKALIRTCAKKIFLTFGIR